MSQSTVAWSGVFVMLGFLIGAPPVTCAQQCQIEAGSVAGIRIGAVKADVIARLSAGYSLAEETKAGSSPRVIARARIGPAGGATAFVIGLDSDRVFLIDSYEKCVTKEGIGPGVTLGRAQAAYGRARIDPTDMGYFVWFDRKPGVMFLLDDSDIPASLRGIPDDVISSAQERKILGVKKARIVMTRLSGG